MQTYEPLNTLKPFGEGLWIVDGPLIRMDLGPFKVPFPTRMCVARLADGGLWVHSPIAPDEGLFEQIDALGPVAHLVAPNSIHYWYMADWLARYPEARSHAVADLVTCAKRPFRIDDPLDEPRPRAWDGEIDWLLVPGTKVNEAVFFHRASRTVLLADLIENFEGRKVDNPLLRVLIRLAGGMDPDGKVPIDLRLTFWPKRADVRRRIAQAVAWEPERVVMAHGRPYEANGADEMRRAFRWAL
ncbi:DUF4336 domain-containing protein [Novosphingobium sp. PC22D]|uniref:DUF4336 domain-containing protein n=1 Tax=Novosphingobium sp. PC22D TaxID=1962403 RepID=UPI000BEF2DB8|nr:DUF4336 domain-containing protein [Novosphingobium sp. PC22D]PEQ13198.1 DUF4336 domain-containing protein [Novosphingobium sp. PC22D]